MTRYYVVRVGTQGEYRWLDNRYNPTILCRENAFKFRHYDYARKCAKYWSSGYIEAGLDTREVKL
jgi:hypothetical protein